MLRRLLSAGIAVGILATPAAAQPSQQLLMPGVTYERRVDLTLHGPVQMHIITAPKPGDLYQLAPTLARGSLQSGERLTSIERRLASTATVAGINGDSATKEGRPDGIVLQGGVLQSPPDEGRSSLGVDSAQNLLVRPIELTADWRGNGPLRRLKGLNRPPLPGWTTLYTPIWGAATPASRDTLEAVLSPFPSAQPNTDLVGQVTRIAPGGWHPIPPGGAVLTARGSSRERLRTEAPVGTVVTVRLLLPTVFAGVVDGIGGGPELVENGRPVFHTSEDFDTSWLAPRMARSAVGQRADGGLVLVAVDGGRPGYSVGMTNFELAQTMVRLGAVTAMALDGGNATTMAFDGNVLNRPAKGQVRIPDGLLLAYYGVQAPPPAEEVVSPNGDGVDEQQTLAYKLVRPSTVTATLTAPDGSTRVLDSATRASGVYSFTWTGLDSNDQLEPEGRWVWTVDALDDLGRSSEATREFSLNTTLAHLAAQPVTVSAGGGSITIDLDLLHPADLTVQVETQKGAVLRVLRAGVQAPGHVQLQWKGRLKAKAAPPGRYVIRAFAVNDIGRMDLTAPIRLR
jgi:flagellar hook assembly protein FlgD